MFCNNFGLQIFKFEYIKISLNKIENNLFIYLHFIYLLSKEVRFFTFLYALYFLKERYRYFFFIFKILLEYNLLSSIKISMMQIFF